MAFGLLVSQGSAGGAISIQLSPATTPDSANYPPWSTIEFTAADISYFHFPENTMDWETGNLPPHASALPIVIGRCKDAQGHWQVFVDSRLDQDFAKDTALVADTSGNVFVYKISAPARAGGSPDEPTDNFRLKFSGSMTVARRIDLRSGVVHSKSGDIPILMYKGLDVPSYGISKSTVLLADTTRDGNYSPNWGVGADGKLIAQERFELNWPIVLDGQRVIARKIDPNGAFIELGQFPSDTFAAPGYCSANWNVVDMHAKSHSCASFHGKVVVILMWSTTCHFCEQVRPDWNEFVAQCDTSRIQCIACADDGDSQPMIAQFMRTHPFEGMVVSHDKTLWMLNHGAGTPSFCVIDPDGVVQMIGSGSSFFPVVRAKVNQMLEP